MQESEFTHCKSKKTRSRNRFSRKKLRLGSDRWKGITFEENYEKGFRVREAEISCLLATAAEEMNGFLDVRGEGTGVRFRDTSGRYK